MRAARYIVAAAIVGWTGRTAATVRAGAAVLTLVVGVAACSTGSESGVPSSSLTSTTTIGAASTTTVTTEPATTSVVDRLVLDGVTMSPTPSGFAVRENGTSGTEGQRVTSFSFGGGELGSFTVAVHRGPGLAASFASDRYRPSSQSSERGRAFYEAEVVIWKELGWAESDDVIAFVTSTDFGFSELAAIAETVYVDP